jgi:TolB protein
MHTTRAMTAGALLVALATALIGAPSPGAAAQSPNGEIVFDVYDARADAADLYTVDPAGGRQRVLVRSKADETQGAFSPDGTRLVFARILGHGRADLFVADADGGNITKLIGDGRWYMDPIWSPDGKRIAFFSERDDAKPGADEPPPPTELYTIGADGKNLRRLTRNRAVDLDPHWTPDGRGLVFTSDRDARPGSTWNIYRIDADGSNARRITRIGGRSEFNPSVSPDGGTIVYETGARDRSTSDIWSIGMNGHHPRSLIAGPRWESTPVWSPDGNLVAFASDRQAKRSRERLNSFFELWVMDVRDGSMRRLTNDRLATVFPEWRPLLAS